METGCETHTQTSTCLVRCGSAAQNRKRAFKMLFPSFHDDNKNNNNRKATSRSQRFSLRRTHRRQTCRTARPATSASLWSTRYTSFQGCSLFSFFPPKIAGFILVFFLFLLYPQRQFFPAFLPDLSQSRSVVGDIRKNGQNFSDLNFHKI